METFAIGLLGWTLALTICVTLGTINGNNFRRKEKELKKRINDQLKIIVDQLETVSKLEFNKKIARADFEKILKENKEERDIITKNAENLKLTFEDEIDTLEEQIMILKSRLHSEQVDSNNKEYARDKWRTKFETLENIVRGHGFAKELMKKYNKTWQEIILAYNKAKKGIK